MRRLGFALSFLAWLGLCLWPAAAQVPTWTQIPIGTSTLPLTASSTFTTGTATATLTGAANRWTYICGFVITTAGTTAATSGTVTVTGTTGGTLNFTYTFVSSGQGVLGVALNGCIVSSAQNTSIVVNVPAGGAGTTGSVTAWGYTN